jgi:hypothetical protein
MYHMRLCEGNCEEIVDVCWEALEAGLISHEPMDVNKQQGSPSISARL